MTNHVKLFSYFATAGGFIDFTPAESEASRVHRRKPALGVAALQGVAQVSAVHENANIRHQADIPQVEGKKEGERKYKGNIGDMR